MAEFSIEKEAIVLAKIDRPLRSSSLEVGHTAIFEDSHYVYSHTDSVGCFIFVRTKDGSVKSVHMEQFKAWSLAATLWYDRGKIAI